jgi:hypothetical protein
VPEPWLPDEKTASFFEKLKEFEHSSGFDPNVYVDKDGRVSFSIHKNDAIKILKLDQKYGFTPKGEKIKFTGFLLESQDMLGVLIMSGFFNRRAPIFIFAPKEKTAK